MTDTTTTAPAEVTDPPLPPLVGLREVAELLQVARNTANVWRTRNVLPAPEAIVSGEVPVWRRSTIVEWARRTGRLPAGVE